MKRHFPAVCLVLLLSLTRAACVSADESPVQISQADGKFVVTVSGQPFCEVDYQSYAKPIVYPIFGPDQVAMTRNYPMRSGAPGEATDHPHHKSMWFGHGDVNGVSFWDEKGKTINETAELVAGGELPAVRLESRLVDPAGKLVCRETMLLSFGADEAQRWIDWQITAHAGEEPLVFGDTKEGTAALRVHPHLRPDNKATRGTPIALAKAVNSEGLKGDDIWGKRAKWVDYSGTIDGHLVGIAFFDHPGNLRHPTYWHARSYGLFAANPFGLSHFVGSGSDGTHTVPAGDSLVLRYRIVFHRGDAETAKVEQIYQDYVQQAK
jgi:hypothetical protein